MKRYAMLAALLWAACASGPQTTSTTLHTVSVTDAGATFDVELVYEPKGNRMVEVTLKMRNSGIEESDKVVSTVSIKGFDIEEGNTYWDGFIPPRQPQSHRLLLVIPEDIEFASATFSLKRSDDSEVLMREDLGFDVGADGVVKARP